MNDHQRDDLHFAHRALVATGERVRAAEQLADAEDALYAALDRRMFRAITTGRLKSERATDLYNRLYVAPQFSRYRDARKAAQLADRAARDAARAYDKALDRAAERTTR